MENRFAYVLRLVTCLSLALPTVLGQQSAWASEIEKWLIMPGPVVVSHADIEAECNSCHAPLSDQLQGELCVACHTEIGGDVQQQSGFHGRLPKSQQLDCASCHSDHEGRDMNIVDLDEESFDHRVSDFPLHGAHLDVACGDCHAADSVHRDAPSGCVDCHRSDDVHKGQLGNDCASCHSDRDWVDTKFDHNRTRFPLSGGHMGVSCGACHMKDDFAEVGRTCVACHQSDDVHKGRNGAQCADCHSVATWKNPTFNHFVITGFGLLGGHKGLACETCHRNLDFSDPGNSNCESCHSQDDVHEGRFGTNCGSCHGVFRWGSVRFDHKRETNFLLPAGHDSLPCTACHTGALDDALPTACGSCHADDDVHLGQVGERCESCHFATNWTGQLMFDHDITSFPLVGAHANIACEQCHATAAFHDVDTNCGSCHAADDTHRGALGDECDRCHNPSSWRAWQFNHNVQTSFPLTGSHSNLACNACHTEEVGPGSAVRDDCNSCHRRDDPHFGRFGNNCEACHTTSSFTQIEGM